MLNFAGAAVNLAAAVALVWPRDPSRHLNRTYSDVAEDRGMKALLRDERRVAAAVVAGSAFSSSASARPRGVMERRRPRPSRRGRRPASGSYVRAVGTPAVSRPPATAASIVSRRAASAMKSAALTVPIIPGTVPSLTSST